MLRLRFVLVILFSYQLSVTQNLNDNCENATDVSQEIFHYTAFPESCNSIIGTIHPQHGLVSDNIENPTVDIPVYSSQGCIGYKPETTDYYPDLWYKSTFHEETSVFAQSFFVYAGDTVQVAIYYGQCGSLFQSQCFTLAYTDSTYWQGAWIKYYPHHPEDDIYIQLKVPPQYLDLVEFCFSQDIWVPGVGIQYYFEYDRPAGTQGGTFLNSVLHQVPLTLFPNPTNTWLQIRSEEKILTYSIVDLQGKVWTNEKCNNNIESIYVSNLPLGIYVISVITETGIGLRKFLKS